MKRKCRETRVWNVTDNGSGWSYGKTIQIPRGYAFVPAGNAALTRSIKRKARTVYCSLEKGTYFTKVVGIYATKSVVDDARRELELTETERTARRKCKQKRDIAIFMDEIRKSFPSIPDADVLDCAVQATEIGSGRVGRSSIVDDPVGLAVLAYARHNYTSYEELVEGIVDRDDYQDIKRSANVEAGKILDLWRDRKEEHVHLPTQGK